MMKKRPTIKNKKSTKKGSNIKKKSTNVKKELPHIVLKKKEPIMVKRSTKELITKMNKKDKKKFIRELKEKKHPNFGLALETKVIWEKLRRFFFNNCLLKVFYEIFRGFVFFVLSKISSLKCQLYLKFFL